MTNLRDDLQELVGFSPKIEVEEFTNWAGTQVRQSILACRPTQVVEVQAIIRGARKLGLKVRAAGQTHSWSPVFSDDGQVVIYVKDLKRPDGPKLQLEKKISHLKKQFGGKVIQHLPHAVHFQDYIQDVPVYDMEWSFSLDPDCSNLLRAVQGVVKLVYKEALEGRFPMNLPLEMRFMADSDAYMAPASCANPTYGGSGHACCIEVLAVAETPDFHEFCIKVADVWKPLTGAKPHWCKQWGFLPEIDRFLQQAYSAQIPKFIKALERSGADPDGMFFNKRLEGLFYPEGHPGGHPGC